MKFKKYLSFFCLLTSNFLILASNSELTQKKSYTVAPEIAEFLSAWDNFQEGEEQIINKIYILHKKSHKWNVFTNDLEYTIHIKQKQLANARSKFLILKNAGHWESELQQHWQHTIN